MKRRILGTALAALLATTAPAAWAENLADALASGYETSGLLDQNRALLRAADEDVAQAVANLRPVVEWAASASSALQDIPGTDYTTTSLEISAQLTLYDGGRNALAVDQQKETVLATRESLRNVEQQVLLRVVQAYLEVQRSMEFVALRQNNVRLITQELSAAQDRFEVGEVTRTDVSLAEARLASARSLLASEEGGLVRAREEYKAAVGHYPGTLAAAPPFAIRQSISEARALAIRIHPAVLQAQHSVTSAEIGIERANRATRPTLSLGASVGVDPQDIQDDPSRRVTLSMGAPIYSGGALASALRQIMAQRDATRAGLHVTVQNVDQGVGNAFSYLDAARAGRDASDRSVRASSVAFDGVREEATLGARTTLDVLDAEQELLDARANLISSQIDETVASYTVLSSMGLLTAESLNLAVQLYDPSAYYNLVDDAPVALSSQGQALDRVLEALGREN